MLETPTKNKIQPVVKTLNVTTSLFVEISFLKIIVFETGNNVLFYFQTPFLLINFFSENIDFWGFEQSRRKLRT